MMHKVSKNIFIPKIILNITKVIYISRQSWGSTSLFSFMSTKSFALEKPAELSLQTQPEIIVGHWHWQWHCATMLNAFTFFSVKRIHCARKGFTGKSLTRILLIEIDHFFPRTQSDLFCFSCHLFRRQFRFRFGNVAFQLLVS
jgi:hypothetical protein